MKNFDEWLKNIEKDYPKYQDKEGYTIGNTRALKAGWKAAMRLILTTFKCNLATEDNDELTNVYKMIESELEEK
jgi:hypothetical protein